MNNMQKWKAGWTGPDQKIKYRKAASREEIDDLVFLSRVISVIAEDDCTEFIFLECDLVSFISVKYFDDGKYSSEDGKTRITHTILFCLEMNTDNCRL